MSKHNRSHRTYMVVSSAIFTVVAALHAVRVFMEWEAVVGGFVVPVWFSVAAVILAGYLAIRGFGTLR